jgi:hypothetical protein
LKSSSYLAALGATLTIGGLLTVAGGLLTITGVVLAALATRTPRPSRHPNIGLSRRVWRRLS